MKDDKLSGRAKLLMIHIVLTVLQEMVSEGLVAMTDVEFLHHTSGKWNR